MLGAIIGDMVGSAYEFNNIKTTDFPLFSEESNYTDDTIMTMAIADFMLTPPDYHETITVTMVDYANAYPCPKGGYGGRFRTWLFHPEQLPPYDGSRQPYNSWGNGSAMRVSFVGWCWHTIEDVETCAKATAEVTHNHPEGIKGAQATAVAILLARMSLPKEQIRSILEQRYGYNLHRTCDEIRPTYQFNESCQETVPEAIIAFLESTDFESAIRLAVSLGGDSDTLACITGGIAEAYYRHIPDWIKEEAMKRLPEQFKKLLERMYDHTKDSDERLKDKISQPTREQIMIKFKLDEFYAAMAKEEGVTTFKPKTREIHLLDFIVAGTTFCKEFDKKDQDFIKEGMTLIVKREDNKHDANAIALYVDDIKIGYVPKAKNEVLAKLLDGGKFLVSRVKHAQYKDGWEKICLAQIRKFSREFEFCNSKHYSTQLVVSYSLRTDYRCFVALLFLCHQGGRSEQSCTDRQMQPCTYNSVCCHFSGRNFHLENNHRLYIDSCWNSYNDLKNMRKLEAGNTSSFLL